MTFATTLGRITTAATHLQDVHSENTFALLLAETGVIWHEGDVAIISGVGAPDDLGTRVYVGTTSGSPHQGTTAANDWLELAQTDPAVVSIVGFTGAITADQILTHPDVDVQSGADVTPEDGIYLAPTVPLAGRVAKINSSGEWAILEEEAAPDVDLTSTPSASVITLGAGGATTAIGEATTTTAGIVTAANFDKWNTALASVVLAKTNYSAVIVAAQNVYDGTSFSLLTQDIDAHHTLSYNGLILTANVDYTFTDSAITLTGPTPGDTLAALTAGDFLRLEISTTTSTLVQQP